MKKPKTIHMKDPKSKPVDEVYRTMCDITILADWRGSKVFPSKLLAGINTPNQATCKNCERVMRTGK